tara:strand:+ start:3102 stop:4808 length:1707 start_codon:yes stop_codon:yes gene_type:complete
MMEIKSDFLRVAMEAAFEGYPVFPVKPFNKEPIYSGGFHTATREVEQIQEWAARHPEANVGVPTGEISGISVIDIDGENGIASMKSNFNGSLPPTRTHKTPRGGYHLLYEYDPLFHNRNGSLPNVDIKTDGGYIIWVGSVVNGRHYELHKALPVVHIGNVPEVFQKITKEHQSGRTESPDDLMGSLLQGVGEGGRQQGAAQLIGTLRRSGHSREAIIAIMHGYADRCTPPWRPEIGIEREVDAFIARYPIETIFPLSNGQIRDTERVVTPPVRIRTTPLPTLIEQYVDKSSGYFSVDEIDREFHIISPEEKTQRRAVLGGLIGDGVIQHHPSANSRFRKITPNLDVFDFSNMEEPDALDIQWPLGLEDYIEMYEGSLAVVAGSPNAGKTAFLLNLALMNRDRFQVHYINSEMGAKEMLKRLTKFEGIPMPEWGKIRFSQKKDNMVDAVQSSKLEHPALVIVDYLELHDEVFRVAQMLGDMTDAMNERGILVVGIQKKIGQQHQLGRGAEFSIERARLALAMDKDVVSIMKGKNWRQDNVDPNGLRKEFQILNGSKFLERTGWIRPVEK